MDGQQFEHFCIEYKHMMLRKNPAYVFSGEHVARDLGVQPRTVTTYKSKGAGRHIALACSAILAGLNPYGEDK